LHPNFEFHAFTLDNDPARLDFQNDKTIGHAAHAYHLPVDHRRGLIAQHGGLQRERGGGNPNVVDENPPLFLLIGFSGKGLCQNPSPVLSSEALGPTRG
jgi:hypothetical protein